MNLIYLYFISTVQIPIGKTKYSWIKANVGQTGFYRVNYDKKNWNRLMSQLSTNHKVSNNIISSTFSLLLIFTSQMQYIIHETVFHPIFKQREVGLKKEEQPSFLN